MASLEVAQDVLLYYKIKVKHDDNSYSEGIVKYIGSIMGKKGVYVGIDVTKGKGKNDGTYKGIRYFETKNGGKTGRFTSLELDKVNIVKSTPTDQALYHYHWGEVVYCEETKCKGTVRSIGIPSWSDSGNVYYGLELAKKKGDHNGNYEGVSYFKCKAQYGIYVESDEVDHSDEFERTKKKKKQKTEKRKNGKEKKSKRKGQKKEDVQHQEVNQKRADKVRRERKERMKETERQEQEQLALNTKQEIKEHDLEKKEMEEKEEEMIKDIDKD